MLARALRLFLAPKRVMCEYSHPTERDQPLLVGATVIPERDARRGSVLALRGDLGLERQTRKILFVVRGGLTDPGSCPSQAPNLVSAGSKPAARMTVFKRCLASLSLKTLGLSCAMCIFW